MDIAEIDGGDVCAGIVDESLKMLNRAWRGGFSPSSVGRDRPARTIQPEISAAIDAMRHEA